MQVIPGPSESVRKPDTTPTAKPTAKERNDKGGHESFAGALNAAAGKAKGEHDDEGDGEATADTATAGMSAPATDLQSALAAALALFNAAPAGEPAVAANGDQTIAVDAEAASVPEPAAPADATVAAMGGIAMSMMPGPAQQSASGAATTASAAPVQLATPSAKKTEGVGKVDARQTDGASISPSANSPAVTAPALAAASPEPQASGAGVATRQVAEGQAGPTSERSSDAAAPDVGISASFANAMSQAAGPSDTALAAPSAQAPRVAQVDEVANLVATHVARGDQHVSIVLRPKELGEVQVRVEVQEGRVSIKMDTDNKEATALLRDKAPELKSILAAQGLTVNSIDVSLSAGDGGVRDNGSQSMSSNQSDSGQHGSHEAPDPRDERLEREPPQATRQLRKKGLDVLV